MIQVRVSGLHPLLGKIKSAPKQIKFALTVAVNETAKEVQKHTITKLLPGAFTLRSRGAPWWRPGTRMGFNIRFAKRSQPEPTAIIGSRADWLPLQEKGGTKQLKGKSIAIPFIGSARPAPTAVVPGRVKPKRLLGRARTFVVKGRRGRVVLSRTGKARYPVRIWYAFEPDATIKPVLRFGPTESMVAAKALGPAFQKAIAKALATARP